MNNLYGGNDYIINKYPQGTNLIGKVKYIHDFGYLIEIPEEQGIIEDGISKMAFGFVHKGQYTYKEIPIKIGDIIRGIVVAHQNMFIHIKDIELVQSFSAP